MGGEGGSLRLLGHKKSVVVMMELQFEIPNDQAPPNRSRNPRANYFYTWSKKSNRKRLLTRCADLMEQNNENKRIILKDDGTLKALITSHKLDRFYVQRFAFVRILIIEIVFNNQSALIRRLSKPQSKMLLGVS